jgi:biotin carboxylase
VRQFAALHPVDAVFGVDDGTAVAAAHAARALGLPHNSVDSCEAARDKHRQRVVLAREGLPVPPFALHRFDDDLPNLARLAPYPCVLKPTHLAMSRGVMRADDPDGFVRAAHRLRAIVTRDDAAAAGRDAFLVERFIPGDEFALEGVLVKGQLRVLALFDKPDPLDGPFFEETIYATPSRLSAERQGAVAAVVERGAAALGLRQGPVHAEVRLNEAGPWILEIAARPIGGRCSAVLRFGERGEISLEELLLSQALGLATDAFREHPAAAVMMVPVPRAGTLVAVGGVSDARRVPWIDDVVITAHPGQKLEPLPEGNHYLGFIYAWADDAATAVAALRAAHAKLAVELE